MAVIGDGLTLAGTAQGRRGAMGVAFRAQQQALISQGRYLDALGMDVKNIRDLFGAKYDGAIHQLGEFVWEANQ